MVRECIFVNDDNVKILLPHHRFTEQYATRVSAEALFRRISAYLIKIGMVGNGIIDLGSWMGDNAIPWAKNIKGIVYGIDPSGQNCEFTGQLADLNEISNIKIIQRAISDKNELLSTNDDINHCSFVYPPVGIDGATKVEAYSLDYLYAEGEINNIDYIHLDVEGMEFRVIIGAKNLIQDFKPIIAFEQHIDSDNYIELSDYLKLKGYSVYLINETFAGCKPDCRNLLAIPDEKLRVHENLIENIHIYLGQNNILSSI